MNTLMVRLVVAATLLVIVAALYMELCTPPPVEQFTPQKTSYDELLGRKVALVRRLPAIRDPATVYFLVDASNRLLNDPRLPWEGQSMRTVLNELHDMFGVRSVEATTVKHTAADDKVLVIYDPRTLEVTKVLVPRRWAVPPRTLKLRARKSRLDVLLNPLPGTRLPRRTLILKTAPDSRVTSATIR